MPPKDKQQKKAEKAKKKAKMWAAETPQQANDALRHAANRAQESLETRKSRLEEDAVRHAARLAQETPQRAGTRRQQDAAHHRARRNPDRRL